MKKLFVNSEFRFAPSALSSATGTLGIGNLWSKPRGRRAVRQKPSCSWRMSVKETAESSVKVFGNVV